MRVTAPSACPWLDHPASGLIPVTESPYSDSLSLRLPYAVKLATERKSLTHYTKGTQSPQLNRPSVSRALVHGSVSSWRSFAALAMNPLARQRRPIELGLPLFVCMRFQDLFHSPSGVLLTFPSRYLFTIGRLRVFSLGGWSPHLQTGFHVSRPTCRKPSSTFDLSRTGLSPTTADLSRSFHSIDG